MYTTFPWYISTVKDSKKPSDESFYTLKARTCAFFILHRQSEKLSLLTKVYMNMQTSDCLCEVESWQK